MTDRRHEVDRLEELHEATRDLMAAETPDEVARVATEAAKEVLGLKANGVFFHEGDELVPVAASEAGREVFGEEIPSLKRGESMGWRVFERGEPAVYDDVREAEVMQNPDTPIRSELILPLGEFGVFITGTPRPAEFDDDDVSVAGIFANTVEAALRRAEREASLREREQELERQNERLEEFASVVSHDLRTPLNVAMGRLDLALEDCDSEHLDDVERALDRMEALIEDLLTLARTGRQAVKETRPVDLEDMVRTVAGQFEVPVTVESGLGTVEANPSRLRALLENLVRNSAEHGGTDVQVWVGPLAEGRGFYVADDGPGIPPGEQGKVFDPGYTTADEGTGFGLAIVRDVAAAHGWSVDAGTSDGGGARFEVRIDEDAAPFDR